MHDFVDIFFSPNSSDKNNAHNNMVEVADEGPEAELYPPIRSELEVIKSQVSECIAAMRRSILAVKLPAASATPPEERLAQLIISLDGLIDMLGDVSDGIAAPREWMEQRSYGIPSAMRERCTACGRELTTREARTIERRAAERGPVPPNLLLSDAAEVVSRSCAAMDAATAEAAGRLTMEAAQMMESAIDGLGAAFVTAVNSASMDAPVWTGEAGRWVDPAQREVCSTCNRGTS